MGTPEIAALTAAPTPTATPADAPAAAALTAALKMVSRAEQCRPILTRKLRLRGYPKDAAASAVSTLNEKGLVDDERFSRLWIQSRVNRKAESPRKLLAGLLSKGIDSLTARNALKEALTPEAEAGLLRRFVDKSGIGKRALLRAEGFSSEALDTMEDSE